MCLQIEVFFTGSLFGCCKSFPSKWPDIGSNFRSSKKGDFYLSRIGVMSYRVSVVMPQWLLHGKFGHFWTIFPRHQQGGTQILIEFLWYLATSFPALKPWHKIWNDSWKLSAYPKFFNCGVFAKNIQISYMVPVSVLRKFFYASVNFRLSRHQLRGLFPCSASTFLFFGYFFAMP